MKNFTFALLGALLMAGAVAWGDISPVIRSSVPEDGDLSPAIRSNVPNEGDLSPVIKSNVPEEHVDPADILWLNPPESVVDLIWVTSFASSDPWLIIGQRDNPPGDTCLIDVNVWPHKWQPTADYEEGCEFGEVIVHEAEVSEEPK